MHEAQLKTQAGKKKRKKSEEVQVAISSGSQQLVDIPQTWPLNASSDYDDST